MWCDYYKSIFSEKRDEGERRHTMKHENILRGEIIEERGCSHVWAKLYARIDPIWHQLDSIFYSSLDYDSIALASAAFRSSPIHFKSFNQSFGELAHCREIVWEIVIWEKVEDEHKWNTWLREGFWSPTSLNQYFFSLKSIGGVLPEEFTCLSVSIKYESICRHLFL